ncbi:sigma E protease regulator RseP [Motiliproteus sp. SC1-56]|uniref:sigma E protease regulator RseP n=1 Tax=Motiliproteus sp. SC1-56 TaxID=2799565 RepID=UPI001A8CF6E5|nr:sigma E protease regulator RseP [Motiliproteus sp. SC1-56]
MGFLQTVVAAIVTLGILVTIHEYGHFWVARRFGVKVLRFSIGFGKGLYRWYDRRGTEYVIAAIPLGGYVKMLDEREAPVAPAEQDQAFNRKSVGQRIAIVAAGPVVNLLFAAFAYWLLFVSGVTTVTPVVGAVQPQSPAAAAGLRVGEEVVEVDGHATRSWEEVSLRLAARIGESGELRLRTREVEGGGEQRYRLMLNEWQVDEEQGPLASLGIIPWRPALEPRIGQVAEQGRAAAAGLQPGDLVRSINAEPVTDWVELVKRVQAHPEASLTLVLERQGEPLELVVTPAARTDESGRRYGYIGAGVAPVEWPAAMQREIRYGLFEAVPAAVAKSYQMITLILESIGKMIQGAISVKNLSGPITIAKVAGASAESGLESFLNFLAYLSISLGVLNLLPIPMLDGGHLLYYLIEAARGRPVSERVQILGLKIGMALLLSLMLMALYNDLARL